MKRALIACAVASSLLAGGCATVEDNALPTGFINKTMVVNGEEREYVVFVPRDYDPGKEWPLVVFLHGAGERGRDGYKQSAVGLGHAIRFRSHWFPCLVVMPQCPPAGWWADAPQDWAKDLKAATADIDIAMADTMRDYSVDTDRIYLTGLSMGGFGTWVYGAQHTDIFAAFMPICGGGNVDDAAALSKVPIWAFHGADDSVVPADRSREMVEAVKKAGGNVQYTEYPGVNHNSWDKAYAERSAIKWLLDQRKN
ncbi:MAG: hypothetical protein GY851_05210 [bacterium]|nr:hypothetical protein [bacterium]